MESGRVTDNTDKTRWRRSARQDEESGKTTWYRTINDFKGSDHIHFESSQSADGKTWTYVPRWLRSRSRWRSGKQVWKTRVECAGRLPFSGAHLEISIDSQVIPEGRIYPLLIACSVGRQRTRFLPAPKQSANMDLRLSRVVLLSGPAVRRLF